MGASFLTVVASSQLIAVTRREPIHGGSRPASMLATVTAINSELARATSWIGYLLFEESLINYFSVAPAKAGAHNFQRFIDSRLRGNDVNQSCLKVIKNIKKQTSLLTSLFKLTVYTTKLPEAVSAFRSVTVVSMDADHEPPWMGLRRVTDRDTETADTPSPNNNQIHITKQAENTSGQ